MRLVGNVPHIDWPLRIGFRTCEEHDDNDPGLPLRRVRVDRENNEDQDDGRQAGNQDAVPDPHPKKVRTGQGTGESILRCRPDRSSAIRSPPYPSGWRHESAQAQADRAAVAAKISPTIVWRRAGFPATSRRKINAVQIVQLATEDQHATCDRDRRQGR